MAPSAYSRRSRGSAHDERTFVAETRFTGVIASCLFRSADVSRLLPPSLHLGRAPRSPHDRHPLVFIFGVHDQCRVFYASVALPTGRRFPEFVIAVPFVRASAHAGPAMFVPRVFSGEPVATWSGNAHYGFAKRMVPMEWLGETFVVSDENGGLLAHATAEPLGPWRRSKARGLRALADAVDLGRLPILGHRPDGALVESHFDWDFADAWVRPVRATASIDAPVGGGLDPHIRGGSPVASLEVSGMRWRLSWPGRGP